MRASWNDSGLCFTHSEKQLHDWTCGLEKSLWLLCVCSRMHVCIRAHSCLHPSLTPDSPEKCPSSFSHDGSNPEAAGAVGIQAEGCWLLAEPCGVIPTGLGVVIVGCMLGPWSWFTEEGGAMVPSPLWSATWPSLLPGWPYGPVADPAPPDDQAAVSDLQRNSRAAPGAFPRVSLGEPGSSAGPSGILFGILFAQREFSVLPPGPFLEGHFSPLPCPVGGYGR